MDTLTLRINLRVIYFFLLNFCHLVSYISTTVIEVDPGGVIPYIKNVFADLQQHPHIWAAMVGGLSGFLFLVSSYYSETHLPH